MKIPPFLLTQRVSVRNYIGETAYGQTWGDPREVKVRVESRKRVAVGAQGADVNVQATVFCLPDEDIPVESIVTLEGRDLKAISSRVHYDLAGGQYREVELA